MLHQWIASICTQRSSGRSVRVHHRTWRASSDALLDRVLWCRHGNCCVSSSLLTHNRLRSLTWSAILSRLKQQRPTHRLRGFLFRRHHRLCRNWRLLKLIIPLRHDRSRTRRNCGLLRLLCGRWGRSGLRRRVDLRRRPSKGLGKSFVGGSGNRSRIWEVLARRRCAAKIRLFFSGCVFVHDLCQVDFLDTGSLKPPMTTGCTLQSAATPA